MAWIGGIDPILEYRVILISLKVGLDILSCVDRFIYLLIHEFIIVLAGLSIHMHMSFHPDNATSSSPFSHASSPLSAPRLSCLALYRLSSPYLILRAIKDDIYSLH